MAWLRTIELIVVCAFCGYAAFMLARMHGQLRRLVDETVRVARELAAQKRDDADT